jgi:hypothetical protein
MATRRWNDAESMLRTRSVTSGAQRLAMLLLKLADQYDSEVRMAMLTQEELAEAAKLSPRSTVTLAARGWLEAVIELGQNVPEPAAESEYSGKIVLRLPRTLHRIAASLAERDGVSLNTFLATAIAERVGAIARPTVVTFQTQGTSQALSSTRVRKVRYDSVTWPDQSSTILYPPPKSGRLLTAGSVGSRRRSSSKPERKR